MVITRKRRMFAGHASMNQNHVLTKSIFAFLPLTLKPLKFVFWKRSTPKQTKANLPLESFRALLHATFQSRPVYPILNIYNCEKTTGGVFKSINLGSEMKTMKGILFLPELVKKIFSRRACDPTCVLSDRVARL